MEERSPFTHILVPTDGSEPSVNAGWLAIQIAATHHIPITFAYIVDTLAAEKMASVTSRNTEAIYADLENKGRSYLEYLARLARNRGIDANQVTRRGIPHREIANLAREISADLIVIGQAGVGGPHRVDIGSVSRRVVESAPCPVLVARHPLPRR
ncbi:MAG: universal stress protein [Chloroflexi bacterium]|nr:universal stress protein [Chloroflexota bacterium]